MKKLLYLFCSFMVVLSACNPMEDVYEELDALPRQKTDIRNLAITLTESNYKAIKGSTVPAYVGTSYYFVSEEQAGSLIPLYLNGAYAHLEDGDIINVTYNQLVSAFNSNAVSSRQAYTLTDDDYAAANISSKRFNLANGDADAIKFLNYKYPDPAANSLVILTFNGYNSSISSSAFPVTDTFYFVNGAWQNAYHVSEEDYVSVDNGRFKNFSSSHDTMLPIFFNKFLTQSVLAPVAGEVRYVSYKYFSGGSTQDMIMAMKFDGTKWVKVTAAVTEPASLQFKKKNGIWEPDLTIRYTMVANDYKWIAGQASLGTQPQRDNLNQYGNFYQSWSGNNYYWSDRNIFDALAAMLDDKFPNAEVGQKYEVTYAYYLSGNKVGSAVFEKKENGKFEHIEE